MVLPMSRVMTHLTGEDLLAELAAPLLGPPTITLMELQEVSQHFIIIKVLNIFIGKKKIERKNAFSKEI